MLSPPQVGFGLVEVVGKGVFGCASVGRHGVVVLGGRVYNFGTHFVVVVVGGRVYNMYWVRRRKIFFFFGIFSCAVYGRLRIVGDSFAVQF